MLVAVEKRVLLFALGGSVRLEAGVGQDDNKPFGVLVGGRNRHMLLGDELRKFGGR